MIVVRPVEQVEVYSDSDGEIWIAQANSMDEPDLIRIYPEHVDAVIQGLRAAKVEAEATLAKQGDKDA
jgi:hypothetical protein